MKLLFVSLHFNLSGDSIPIGGVQHHISCVTESLRNKGIEVDWKYPNQVNFVSDFNGYDCVFFNDFFTYKEFCNKPAVMIFHGWEGQYPVNHAVKSVRNNINNKLYSINIGKFIEVLYNTKADLTLYGGYNEIILPVVEPKKNSGVFVGRLEPDNCPKLCLETAKQMNLQLDVFGDGSLRNNLESKYNNFRFHGFMSNKEVRVKMNESEIVFAGGYLSILEGMSLKKPVFSFYSHNIGRKIYLQNLPEDIYIFVSDDVGSVIKEYTDNLNNLSNIINKNYNWVSGQTWDKIADKYVNIAKDLIKNER